jgi:hypothetical protein
MHGAPLLASSVALKAVAELNRKQANFTGGFDGPSSLEGGLSVIDGPMIHASMDLVILQTEVESKVLLKLGSLKNIRLRLATEDKF